MDGLRFKRFRSFGDRNRAGYSRVDQIYVSLPAGTELLADQAKLYKAALSNCFEVEDWGPIEWSIMAKHFERQGKSPYAYHALLKDKWMGIEELRISCSLHFSKNLRMIRTSQVNA
ncbi:ARM repeat superfamily protein [Striga asiatica]|uniref:ARM repeat superfamily protein n=1 Tax=Striga asiatica TaxID=4170 RepID=A0A5A7PQ12_STRAF|nr:ARM repeat superfamily protein [Striga asiatica]